MVDKGIRLLVGLITAVLMLGLSATVAAEFDRAKTIRLATTTSTENSGLLHDLLPRFRAASGYRVHVIAVGTGKALRMARDGDVDLVLVHAPAAEQAFVDAMSSEEGQKLGAILHEDESKFIDHARSTAFLAMKGARPDRPRPLSRSRSGAAAIAHVDRGLATGTNDMIPGRAGLACDDRPVPERDRP